MLDFLIDLDPNTMTMLMVGAFVVVFGGIMLFVFATRGKREMADRLTRVANPTARKEAQRKARSTKRNTLNLRKGAGGYKQLEAMALKFLPNPASMALRLSRTGKEITLGGYILFNVVCFVFGVLITRHMLGMPLGYAILAGLVFGLLLPHMGIGFRIGRRKKRFVRTFPDAIDVLIRGLKAGLPVSESMRVVATETRGPVAEEFTRICDGLKVGRPFEDIMWETAKRVNLTEFDFFIITLSINRETGGNLGETLENLSDMLRKRRQVQNKVKAMSSEAKASAYIIGSLPFLMFGALYMLNADYVMLLFIDPRGWYLVGAGLFMMLLGIGVMVKMTKFEI